MERASKVAGKSAKATVVDDIQKTQQEAAYTIVDRCCGQHVATTGQGGGSHGIRQSCCDCCDQQLKQMEMSCDA